MLIRHSHPLEVESRVHCSLDVGMYVMPVSAFAISILTDDLTSCWEYRHRYSHG